MQAVKVLQKLRPARMTPDSALSVVQTRLQEAALNMQFVQEDILLALQQVDTPHDNMDKVAFNRAKLSMLDWLVAATELKERLADEGVTVGSEVCFEALM